MSKQFVVTGISQLGNQESVSCISIQSALSVAYLLVDDDFSQVLINGQSIRDVVVGELAKAA